MRRFILCALTIFILFSLVIFSWIHEENSDDMLARYQRYAPFSAREMAYRSMNRAFFGNGIVFYHPIFPGLPLKVKMDRMSMKRKGHELIIRFLNIEIDMAATLRARDGHRLSETFRQFVVPDDFFLKPLETMTLLNQDTFKGNIELRLRSQGKNMALTVQVEQNGRPIIIVDTVVLNVPDNRLWGWVYGVVQSASIQVLSRPLLQAVSSYYTAIRRPVPMSLKEAVAGNSALNIQVHLPQPWPIQNLINRF